MKKWILAVALVPAVALAAVIKKPTESPFYVYKDVSAAMQNHFTPAGWMADTQDMKYNPRFPITKENTCIQVKYSAERTQGNGWTGIFFQEPPNNWANMKGGYDLSNYKVLTFKARGEKGGEIIDKFMFGGITGNQEEGDTDTKDTGSVTLTKDWKDYSIDISKLDRTHIIGGFSFVLNADNNPSGATFYLDEIRYIK